MIAGVAWIAALVGGVWALERMRKRRAEMTTPKKRRR